MQITKILIILISFLSLYSFSFFLPNIRSEKIITIMLDPAGDAQKPGRTIDDCSERSITWHFCNALKQYIESKHAYVKCIISRHPGEVLAPLQCANFANRLEVELFLNFNFYQENETKPKIYIYTFSNNDDFVSKHSDLAFYQYDQIHQYNSQKTKSYSQALQNILRADTYQQQFECPEICKCPFKQLIGIKSPAVAFEVGIKTRDDWKKYVEPIAVSLESLISLTLKQTL